MAESIQNAATAVKDAVNDATQSIANLTTSDNGSVTASTTNETAKAAETGETADKTEVEDSANAAAKTYVDEVTGEKVSKTELKRRQKQREKEAKKVEAAAAAPPKPAPKAKTVSAEEEEAHLNPNQYFEIRTRAVQKMIKSQDPDP